MRTVEGKFFQVDARTSAVLAHAVQRYGLRTDKGTSDAMRRIVDEWGTANGCPRPVAAQVEIGVADPRPADPIGVQLRRAREAAKIGRATLADQTETSAGWLRNVENGHVAPSDEAVAKLRAGIVALSNSGAA